MRCREARKKIVPFLDGELEDATEFGAHLKTCPKCRKELEQFQRSFDLTIQATRKREVQIQPSPYLLSRINRRIDELEERSLWKRLLEGFRGYFVRERAAMAGWIVALILLSFHLGRYIQGEAISYNPYAGQQFAESRIELRLGDQMRVPLIRIIGE